MSENREPEGREPIGAETDYECPDHGDEGVEVDFASGTAVCIHCGRRLD